MESIEGIVIEEEFNTPEERTAEAIKVFLARQLGDELTRVSYLPLKERQEYLAWMVDNAIRNGVNLDKPALGFKP